MASLPDSSGVHVYWPGRQAGLPGKSIGVVLAGDKLYYIGCWT